MKILVVQLLRLGDVILSSPVLQGLRDQYPDAEIDLLINKQFENILGLLPKVDNYFTFDRELIQTSLGEKERFVFEGYDRVDSLIQELQARGYDQILNLTHNRLSAYIVGGIECRERVGLWINDNNKAFIETAWFQHLNRDNLAEASERFHYVDIYKSSAQINRPRLGISIYETADSIRNAEAYLRPFRSNRNIVIQALTSDAKKNWGVDRFRACVQDIYRSLPDCHFTILGAPSEETTLVSGFADLSYCKVLICDLAMAYSVIARSDLLITGDTSIKHLAAATKTPVIELSLGSSDFRRTGCYSEKAIIIQTQEACAPCSHFTGCHRTEHFCSRLISSELVSLVATDLIRNQSSQLKRIAEEFSDQAKIYRVDIQTTGTWTAVEVSSPFSEQQVSEIFHKFATKLYVQHCSQEQSVFEIFGSESDRLMTLLKNTFGKQEWKKLLSDLEKKFCLIEDRVSLLETRYYEFRKTSKDAHLANELLRDIQSLRETPRSTAAKFQMTYSVNDQMPAFVRLRKVQLLLQEVKLKSDIELKLIRSLQNSMEA